MEASAYTNAITKAWQGERWAQVFFEKLADSSEMTTYRERWQTLAKLEQVMGDRLQPILENKNLGSDYDRPSHDETVSRYLQLSWTDMLKQMLTIVDPSIAAFKNLLESAPDEHREVVQLLLEHECAIKAFIECEFAESTVDSLEPIRAVIAKIEN